MAYSQELEQRIDGLLGQWQPDKKKMFGGLSYMVHGNMCFAIRGNELLLRADETQLGILLNIPGIHPATIVGRSIKQWLQATAAAIATDADLQELLSVGFDYALHQQPK